MEKQHKKQLMGSILKVITKTIEEMAMERLNSLMVIVMLVIFKMVILMELVIITIVIKKCIIRGNGKRVYSMVREDFIFRMVHSLHWIG